MILQVGTNISPFKGIFWTYFSFSQGPNSLVSSRENTWLNFKRASPDNEPRKRGCVLDIIWAICNDQTAEVTPNGGLVRESPPKWP